jgi:hypothetical protein
VSFDYTRIYSETPPHPGNLLAANTLGTFNVGTDLTYNATTEVHGCAIIDNTKTLVCGIRHGDGGATPVCYGPTPTPCTDPEETAEAWHAYPYHHKLWLYNLDHLAEAKAGTRDPADVDPYETVELNFPLQGTKHTTLGLTYDSANHRLYFAQGSAHDSGAGAMIPVIQGFSVNAP